MNIKTYVISLTDEEIRRKNIKKQLNKLNIEFQFFDAIDFRDAPMETLENYITQDHKYKKPSRPLTRGEIGCSLSHLSLISKLKENVNTDAFLILEDDAILMPQLYTFMHSDKLKSFDWDIIILGYSKLACCDFNSFYLKEPIKKIKKVNDINIGLVWKEWTCGTVSYLINAKCLSKINTIQVSSMADDWSYIKEKFNLSIYHIRPLLVQEDFLSFESSIEKERVNLLNTKKNYLDLYRYTRGIIRMFIMSLKK